MGKGARMFLAFIMAVVSSGLAFYYLLFFLSGIRIHLLAQGMTWTRPAGIFLLLLVGLGVLGFIIYAFERLTREAERGLVRLYKAFTKLLSVEFFSLSGLHILLILATLVGPLHLGPQWFDAAVVVLSGGIGYALLKKSTSM